MDVVVVGSCNIDLISYVPRFPAPGETLHGHKFAMGFGGKGANQCIMAARLGAKTAMVGKVGKDIFGSNYLENFKENGVNTDLIQQTDAAATGSAPIAVDDSGQNAIIIVSGANLLLSEEDIQGAEDLIKSAKVIVCQLEISPESTLAALRLAKKHKVKTILNPAPGQADLHLDMLTLPDFFCPNETEAEIITGMQVQSLEDAYKAMDCLLTKGCQTVILTMGSMGAVFADKKSGVKGHVPANIVKPVDTTGAGDAFIGSLAFYLTQYPDLDLEEHIRRANAIASISVQSHGTQTSFPHRKDLPDSLFSLN